MKKDFKVNYLTQHILYSKRKIDKERLAKHLDLKIAEEIDTKTGKNSFLTSSESIWSFIDEIVSNKYVSNINNSQLLNSIS